MRLINKTKNTILAQDVQVADTLFSRMRGLLGKKELKSGQAIVLKPCNSIHTFFMRFPIDVVFVNKDNKVVKTIPGLKPFCLSGIYFSSSFAIELPAGTIQANLTEQTDTLELI
ncbi:MAG: DUF192 domain-containing protein [Candidatus Omnitrophota bacterium]